jgi:hypothetical protein
MSVVKVGMTKREVKKLLGKPTGRITTRQYARQARRSGVHVVSFGPMPNHDSWLYMNLPAGHDTQITFERGRVIEVSTPPARQQN